MTSFTFLLSSLSVLYLIWRVVRNYFLRTPIDNIPGPPSGSLLAGNMGQLFDADGSTFLDNVVETYGPVSKLYNFFGAKALHIYDLKALHSIHIKDQDNYFRGHQANSTGLLLIGPGLLSTFGPTHRRQRKMLNPVFSAAHMRDLTPLFFNTIGKLRTAIESRVKEGPKDIDVLDWMGRTALELVGQGILGYTFDPLVSESRDEYQNAIREFTPASLDSKAWALLIPYVHNLGTAAFRRRVLDIVPIKSVQRMKNLCDMLYQKAKDILDAKRAAIARGDQELLHMVGEGKDVMSILLKANMNASEEDKLPDEEILAQMGTFILAGAKTTANALSRTFHQLCLHQDAQDRLRAEVVAAFEQYGSIIPYDELSQLPYLDAICRETLRVYPTANLSVREAKADTVLPFSEPVRSVDGTLLDEILVPKGTLVWSNLRGCNTNKALWGENALEWKPDRWLQPLPPTIENARVPGIYANLMTFLSGGHACIGFKFSQLEMKVILAILVSTFKFELSDTPVVWNFGAVPVPATSRESTKPEMPLRVSLVST